MARKPSVFLRISLSNSCLLVLLTILTVIVYKGGASGRLYSVLITSIVFGTYCFFSLMTKFEIDRAVLTDAIKMCWPLTLSSILYYFLSGIDRAFLERLHDNTNFGYYNVAFQISAYTGLIGTALFQTFDPDIYKSIADKNMNRLMKIIFVIVLPCIVINLIFIILARPIIVILTYGRYTRSIGYSQILALRNMVTPLFFILSDIIIGLGFTKLELCNRLIGSIFSILLFKYLILNYGFTGAAWGQSLSMLVMCCISMSFFLYKRVKTY
jgi:O-antigen/teichoic acid export membrane protein